SFLSIWRHESISKFPYSPYPEESDMVNLGFLKLNLSKRLYISKKFFISPMLGAHIMLNSIKSPQIKVWSTDYSDKESRLLFNTFFYGFQIGF
ncbi:MAG: hypothetical protein MH472_13110, partial [Bacteroidia bacterium]|nr:hypothetical protein [Bacteroidia bacterium]